VLAQVFTWLERDIAAEEVGDGIGDASDTNGGPIDDQVGYLRAGSACLVYQDADDPSSDLQARTLASTARALPQRRQRFI
jgi:hypothetical protein